MAPITIAAIEMMILPVRTFAYLHGCAKSQEQIVTPATRSLAQHYKRTRAIIFRWATQCVGIKNLKVAKWLHYIFGSCDQSRLNTGANVLARLIVAQCREPRSNGSASTRRAAPFEDWLLRIDAPRRPQCSQRFTPRCAVQRYCVREATQPRCSAARARCCADRST
jgi:hypothetical protein